MGPSFSPQSVRRRGIFHDRGEGEGCKRAGPSKDGGKHLKHWLLWAWFRACCTKSKWKGNSPLWCVPCPCEGALSPEREGERGAVLISQCSWHCKRWPLAFPAPFHGHECRGEGTVKLAVVFIARWGTLANIDPPSEYHDSTPSDEELERVLCAGRSPPSIPGSTLRHRGTVGQPPSL